MRPEQDNSEQEYPVPAHRLDTSSSAEAESLRVEMDYGAAMPSTGAPRGTAGRRSSSSS